MTRRERMERRLQRRLEWAESRDKKAETAFEAAGKLADMVPLGQPILVGHHSERHARRDAERIRRDMERGVESAKMAKHHRETARGIEIQLDRSVFADDPDAAERLRERIADLEAQRARRKAINAEIRRGDGWVERLREAGCPLTDEERADLLSAARFSDYKGYPPYSLTNLGGEIRRNRKRLAEIEAVATVDRGEDE